MNIPDRNLCPPDPGEYTEGQQEYLRDCFIDSDEFREFAVDLVANLWTKSLFKAMHLERFRDDLDNKLEEYIINHPLEP